MLMSARKFATLVAILFIFVAGFGLWLEQKANEPKTVEFSVKNFFHTELGKINATYKQPLDAQQACTIATAAATQTSLQSFKCTGFNKQDENWQIVYQPSPANVFVFTIDEKKQEILINVGQAN